ncbi:hypothetical protein SCOR_19755 [Sulfidibacter corallicola]|uniref:Uncharacterized protein n=1 Tax=Sulfidibacter corallicola TaxID=2818388 RepID=A0A8A4TUX4_SULCO|nr:hypothetical protein [Sulfidibacter corallicola]QTD53320.1 hypothetical protein J3U87_12770 [Sulfidibacter corallicola]
MNGHGEHERKPIVVIEDHLYHIGEILQYLEVDAPDLIDQITVVCLDRPGPDTNKAVTAWLAAHPDLQVAAHMDPSAITAADRARLISLPEACFHNANRFCRQIAALIAPGGLLVQDIQLSSLHFLPDDRWWESIYLANTIRGMFAAHPPSCRFMSNKTGFEATFGADLFEAGFDPRDVLGKHRLAQQFVPALQRFRRQHFPLVVRDLGTDGWPREKWLGRQADIHEALATDYDLILWLDAAQKVRLSGRLIKTGSGKRCLTLKPDSQESRTWSQLIDAYLQGQAGISVRALGRRLAPEHALQAEMTNAAARHIHGLRARLTQGGAITTQSGFYLLSPTYRIARVDPLSEP